MEERLGVSAPTEQSIIAHLSKEFIGAGINIDTVSVANFYISLKSKPMAILVGPAHSGKSLAAERLALTLTNGDPTQCQILSGHPWWAGKSGNVAFFTETQTRLTANIVFEIMEEAHRPDSTDRVFVICLNHISPAEVDGLFSEIAQQLQFGPIQCLLGRHLPRPMHYPPNLFLIGTIDTQQFDWSDACLRSKTSIIRWSQTAMKSLSQPIVDEIDGVAKRIFLRSCLRDQKAASLKLSRILNQQLATAPLLLCLNELFTKLNTLLPASVYDEIVVYLANSWTTDGIGLFDENSSKNFTIAFGLAIAQILLRHFSAHIESSAALKTELEKSLKDFPRSTVFLDTLNRSI